MGDSNQPLFRSRFEWLVTAAATGVALHPSQGLVSHLFHELTAAGYVPDGTGLWVPVGLAAVGAPFLLGGGLRTFFPGNSRSIVNGRAERKRPPRELFLGDGDQRMRFDEIDMVTNFMALGGIGTGKTSSVAMPLLRQFANIYSEELAYNTDGTSNPWAKFGGLIHDRKGDLADTVIHIIEESGRNALYDVVAIRPDPRIPVMRLKDPDGRLFYVSALSCASGHELSRLMATAKGRFEKPPSDYFLKGEAFHTMWENKLRGVEFDVSNEDIWYLGWRADGNDLIRVTHTRKDRVEERMLDADGKEIRIPKPKLLRPDRIVWMRTGVRYNIIDNNAEVSAAATKVAMVAKMMNRTPDKGGGDNQFFQDAVSKQILFSIQLHKRAFPERECTGIDIVDYTVSETKLRAALTVLEQQSAELRAEAKRESDPYAQKAIEEKITVNEGVMGYFSGEEWAKLDPRTRGNIATTLTNVFKMFRSDPNLRESMCSPSTFSFMEAIEEGKVFIVIPGAYESMVKQLGATFKIDYFESVLRRVGQDCNKDRMLLYLVDEAQEFVISAGSEGLDDAAFTALNRQSRCMYVALTQSISKLKEALGENGTKALVSNMGNKIFLQNDDDATLRAFENLVGKEKRMKETVTGSVGFDGKSQSSMKRELVNEAQWDGKDVIKLRLGKKGSPNGAFIYNKGEDDRDGLIVKAELNPTILTHPKDGRTLIAKTMRRYLRGFVENALYAQGQVDRLNHFPHGATAAVPAGTSSPPANQSAPTPPAAPPSHSPSPASSNPGSTAPKSTPQPAPKPASSPKPAPTPVPPPSSPPPAGPQVSTPTPSDQDSSAQQSNGPSPLKQTLPTALRVSTIEVRGRDNSSGSRSMSSDGGSATPADIRREEAEFKQAFDKVSTAHQLLQLRGAATLADYTRQAVENGINEKTEEAAIVKAAVGPRGVVGGDIKTLKPKLLTPPYEPDPDLQTANHERPNSEIARIRNQQEQIGNRPPPPTITKQGLLVI